MMWGRFAQVVTSIIPRIAISVTTIAEINSGMYGLESMISCLTKAVTAWVITSFQDRAIRKENAAIMAVETCCLNKCPRSSPRETSVSDRRLSTCLSTWDWTCF